VERSIVGPFSAKHLIALGTSVAAIAVVLVIATTPLGGQAATPFPTPGSSFYVIGSPTVGLDVGDRAPELSGTVDGQTIQLTDLDGRPITLASLRGRPVWINFWASWCPPCQAETPILRTVFETHEHQGLEIIGVSVQETSVDDVRRYAETYELGYPIGFDATSAVFKTYRAFGLPTQVFIDREGIVRAVVNGPVTELEAERILAPLLAE
jgi:thiol-disulfide isomerase/thioredoxin